MDTRKFAGERRLGRPRLIFAALLLLQSLWLPVAANAAVAIPHAPRVINNSVRVELPGNVHPLAKPSLLVGITDPALPMERMILSLRLSTEKQAELESFLAEQQDPTSPNFHHWLSPEEFGARFGPQPEDIATITNWLSSQGFTIDEVGKSGTWINFSGTAAKVETAFHTQIRKYNIDGQVRHANAIDPAIPLALADLVSGIVTLHNIPRKSMIARREPAYTSSSGSHYISPGDFATIYNVNPLYAAGIDGTGQTIAIVGRTHPSASNWSSFRSLMGLPANPPIVIVNGSDPGDLGAAENGEADLDVEWSGGVARGATIKFVVSKSTSSSDGVDLSAQYIVNNNLAPVMSTSFGLCEFDLGSTGLAFYNNLWAQAAASGITSFVSSGDSGAADCDSSSSSRGSGGRAVNGLASSPYNIAVGGTQFNEGSGSYWNSTNATGYISAKSYIPEVAWNESGNMPGGSGLWSTGGGASANYSKPSWQVAPGVPADGSRDIPDVSLSSASHDGYLTVTQGSTYVFSGTSAAAPAFAGLMALIVQKTGQRQGNANPRFYQLANAQYLSGGAAVFHDITSGNNSVPGVTGFSTTSGYDLATGLGSVDANALANNWAGATATCTYSLGAASASLGASAAVGGVSISTTASCTWTAVSNASWITITSGASGNGNGSVAYSVAANTSSSSRNGSITIGGQTYTITQAGVSCSNSLSPTSQSAPSTGLIGTINVSSTAVCTWTALSNVSWITVISGASGNGSGTVTYAVAANSSSSSRTGTLIVGGQTFTVSQSGSGGGTTTNQLLNPGFENGATTWTESSSGGFALITNDATLAHAGNYYAWLGGYNSGSDAIYQTVAISADVQTAYVQFWYRISTSEPANGNLYDLMTVDLLSAASGTRLATLKTLSNLDATTGWIQSAQFDVSAYKGQTLNLRFLGNTDSSYPTSFLLDDVSLTTTTASSCNSTLSPANISLSSGSATGSASVLVSAGCIWTAASNTSWIAVTGGASGSGNGSVTYSVAANTSNSSRTGTMTIAGKTFTVTQAGVTPPVCTLSATPAAISTGGTATLSAGCSPAATSYAWSANAGFASTNASGTVSPSATSTYSVTGSNASGTGNTATVTVTVTPITSLLTVIRSGMGAGTVTSSPSGINCGINCAANYAINSSVTLIASPAAGSNFIGWNGACTGTGSCIVSMSAAQSVTATFGTVAGAPTAVSAAPGNAQVTVSFNPPASNGGNAITSYTVTSSPGEVTATGPGSPITVTGLANGTAYTFTVTASNSAGVSPASAPSASVTPTGSSCVISLSPTFGYISSSSGSGSVSVSAAYTCSWSASSNASWITITSAGSGNGIGTVAYALSSNSSDSPRIGTLSIGGQTFTLTQLGRGADGYANQVQIMYIAYFGRPADPGGLAYYSNLMQTLNGSNAALLDDFSNSAESLSLFNQASIAAKLNQVYRFLFSRDADPAGSAYWTDLIASGNISLSTAAYIVAYNAQSDDAAILAAKQSAASVFTAHVDTSPEIQAYTNCVAAGRSWLSTVVSNSTAASATATVDSTIATLQSCSGVPLGSSRTLPHLGM